MPTYKIIRMYQDADIRNQTIKRGLTLAEAQRWCKDPETSSRTCRKSENLQRTKLHGPWFDGYSEEKG